MLYLMSQLDEMVPLFFCFFAQLILGNIDQRFWE
jgi:hypothetical protein